MTMNTKLVLGFLCIAFLVHEIFGCEYHRMLERRRLQEKQRAEQITRDRLQRAQQNALDRVRNSFARSAPLSSSRSYGVPVSSSQSYRQAGLPRGYKICPGSASYYCLNEERCAVDESGQYSCESEVESEHSHHTMHTDHSRHHGSTSRVLPVGGEYPRTTYRKITRVLPSRVYLPSRTGSNYGASNPQYYVPGNVRGRYLPHVTITRPRYPDTGVRYQPTRVVTQRTYTCPAGTNKVNITATRTKCEDIDECSTEEPCEMRCHNNYGSYRCSCDEGFSLLKDKHGCEDINECESPYRRCRSTTHHCLNTEGSFECYCLDGYEERGLRCQDIDECEGDPCSDGKECLNTWGGYECREPRSCPAGYREHENSQGLLCFYNGTSAAADEPHAISYKDVIVNAETRLGGFLASMNFRGDTRFDHSYRVDTLKGEDRMDYIDYPTERSVRIELYSKVPLEAYKRFEFIFLITDTPRRSRYTPYSSYSYYQPQVSRRKVVMNIMPMIAGGQQPDDQPLLDEQSVEDGESVEE